MNIKSLILIFGFINFFTTSLFAGARGFNIPISLGNMDYELYATDVKYGGFGYIYDSNPTEKYFFNYRLCVTFEYFEHYYHFNNFVTFNNSTGSAEYSRIVGLNQVGRLISDHSFGIRLIHTKLFKYWFGPVLRQGFIGADNLGWTLGAGITVAGLNFSIGSRLILGLEVGYMYNKDMFFRNIDRRTYYNDTEPYEKETDHAESHLLLLKFFILLHDRNLN